MADVELKYVEVTRISGDNYYVPYWEVKSGNKGPVVLVTAALHGVEIQGSEVIRQFLPFVSENITRGSCILVPFANPIALQNRQPHIFYQIGVDYSHDTPDNVNCNFPGIPDGTDAQRLAFALKNLLVDRSDYNIDLHCWQETQACTVLCREENTISIKLGEISDIPFARLNNWFPEKKERPVIPCTLTSYFNDTGRSAICIEFSGQYLIRKREVEMGIRALKNCFMFMEMLKENKIEKRNKTIWLNNAKQVKVVAPENGMFIKTDFYPSDHVNKNQLLGYIFTEKDLKTIEIYAPVSGYLYQYGYFPEGDDLLENPLKWRHPYIKKGQTLAKIVVDDKF